MTSGRRKNDVLKLIKKIVIFTVIFWGIVLLFRYWDKQDSKLMEINYCWNSNGEHYIAPDERCNH